MSTELIQEIREAARKNSLTGKGLLVWVSGGVDSVCLLRLLKIAAIPGEIGPLEVVHVDHGLRSDSSADAAFVKALAEELSLPFHLVTLTPLDFSKGMSLQEGARAARRQKLETLRVSRGLAASVLAHHADDQAETVLFRILRGTGPRGGSGMAVWSPPYFRPLIRVRKETLREFAEKSGWPHREDYTNSTPKYTRNRIRNELLPLAGELVPGAAEALCRFALLSGDDDRCLTRIAMGEFKRLAVIEPEGLRFPGEDFAKLDVAVRRRLLLAGAESLGHPASRFNLAHLDTVDHLLSLGGTKKAPVPGPLVFASFGGSLWVYDPARLAPKGVPPFLIVNHGEVEEGEEHLFLGLPGETDLGQVRLRPWSPGDRFMGKKVKDLLMEGAIPRWRRKAALIAEDENRTLGLLAPEKTISLPGPHKKALRINRRWWLSAP